MASGCELDPPLQDATSTSITHKLTLRKNCIKAPQAAGPSRSAEPYSFFEEGIGIQVRRYRQ
jgi:hypothetical protein